MCGQMITVTLYSRGECHLCEQAQADLKSLQEKIPHNLVVLDVDSAKDLKHAYGFDVPVVEVGPYRLEAPFDRQELYITLSAASNRIKQLESMENSKYTDIALRGRSWTKIDSFTYWFARHYLAMFNLFVFIYVGLPFLAPVFMNLGAQAPARIIYSSYSVVCHQLAYRSFFLFGEQIAYPRAAAGVNGLLTFNQASGMGEADTAINLSEARKFVGNDSLGYKVALCERDVSIYGAILLFGSLYSLSGRRLPALPWYFWVLIGLVPIGVDGFSQLLSQPPFGIGVYRESTPLLRSITGGLFGFTTAWFGYSLVEETMSETRRIMAARYFRLKK